MHIVFVAPECAPRIKTGGLGEVLGALPSAIAALGHRVTVFVPMYRTIRLDLHARPDASMPVVLESVTVPFPEENRFVRILDGGKQRGVQSYLVDCPEYFDREGVYGPPGENYPDNALRFGLYCRAVLEGCKQLAVPDVFHLHDWQAAFVSILLRTTYSQDPLLRDAATVFTIHNGGYQGLFPPEQLRQLLLPASLLAREELASEDGKANPFLGALRHSDAVTTVSPSYAEELRTAEYGEGLDAVYRERGTAFCGILNGIDSDEWDPSTDPHTVVHFSSDDLDGKRECRKDLLRAFEMETLAEDTAVIGMVTRLAAQKGFDLIAEAMSRLADRKLVLLVVGRGEPALEEQFHDLAERYPKHLRVSPDFSEALSHKVQAGADMTLMPSRYEPSGLTQMYSLRYGTVPIVRATGGLRDTVQDGEGGDGFAFVDYTPEAMVEAVDRALLEFGNKGRWLERIKRGMTADHGWNVPAQRYLQVYEQAIAAHEKR